MEKTHHKQLYQPAKKAWYKKWWGILLLVFIGLFLSISIASGLFVYSIKKKIQSGEITLEEVLGVSGNSQHAKNQVYGIDRPTYGSTDAPITIVEFTDFLCQKCKGASYAVNYILLDPYYKTKVKFIFRQFPDENNTTSLLAALASECGHEQGKFLEMHNMIFDLPTINMALLEEAAKSAGTDIGKFQACLKDEKYMSEIEQDVADAKALGVKTAPSFIINNQVVEGAPKVEDIKKAIDLLLIKR